MDTTKNDRRVTPRHRFRIFLRTISINWKSIALGVLVGTFLLFNLDWIQQNSASIMNGVMVALQIGLTMAMAIGQFMAIMWFLSRGRMYWIAPTETGITFEDYKGNPDVVELARRVVTLLRGVKQFKQMGGEVSRGLLLIGPPGTGKSYLAQAIASEAGVPFAYLSAPSLQSMWMGVGSMKVMSLYRRARKQARKWGACIVFIDEIDAVGTARSSSMGGGVGMMGGMMGGGGNLLNELLMQMDPPNIEAGWWNKLLRTLGLRVRKAEQPVVFTMAATNLAETLDKALLRPGRFDRKILVSLPDYEGRKDIIKYYLDKVKHDPEMSLDRLASDTIHYSPVEIKFVVNEAVVNAHFSGREVATYRDWSAAREFHEWGLRQPVRGMNQEDRRRIAYHEAGHAVAAWLLRPQEPPVKATIIRHTAGFLGVVQSKPIEERVTEVKEEILADIQVALAARAVEKLVLKTEMNGVTSDLQQATRMAGAYVGMWGMAGSLYSNLAFGQMTPDPKQKAQIEKILDQQFQTVYEFISQHEASVHAMAQALLERDELDKDEIEQIMQQTATLSNETLSAD